MELILDLSKYKDENIGKLIIDNYILNFVYKKNVLSVFIESEIIEETNMSFDLIKFSKKENFLESDILLILSTLNSISYIKNIISIDYIIDLIISNFQLHQRLISNLLLNYIKIVVINDFIFVYKRNIGFMKIINVYQTSKRKKYNVKVDYNEEDFHIKIINDAKNLFQEDLLFANNMRESILQEIS